MQATLLGDGRPFDVIAAERVKSNDAESRNSIPGSKSTARQSS